jgi:exosortase
MQSPWHFGALLVVVGCVATVLGPAVLWKIWPAVLVLVMIVPVPGMVRQRISIPLEQATAFITAGMLKLFGAPVERFGNMITIRGYPVRVAEECNGLRMIFPLLLIVWVFCFTLPLRSGVRAVLLITSPLSAIVCNVIRLLPTVLMFGYASESTARKFHSYSGWPMLPIAFLLLMLIVWLLRAMKINVLEGKA